MAAHADGGVGVDFGLEAVNEGFGALFIVATTPLGSCSITFAILFGCIEAFHCPNIDPDSFCDDLLGNLCIEQIQHSLPF